MNMEGILFRIWRDRAVKIEGTREELRQFAYDFGHLYFQRASRFKKKSFPKTLRVKSARGALYIWRETPSTHRDRNRISCMSAATLMPLMIVSWFVLQHIHSPWHPHSRFTPEEKIEILIDKEEPFYFKAKA
jgi:hypothetical protein